jgi:hypothetical protein
MPRGETGTCRAAKITHREAQMRRRAVWHTRPSSHRRCSTGYWIENIVDLYERCTPHLVPLRPCFHRMFRQRSSVPSSSPRLLSRVCTARTPPCASFRGPRGNKQECTRISCLNERTKIATHCSLTLRSCLLGVNAFTRMHGFEARTVQCSAAPFRAGAVQCSAVPCSAVPCVPSQLAVREAGRQQNPSS